MSFFGLFKSREERDAKKILDKVRDKVFPGGGAQSDREIAEVQALLGNKYSRDNIAKAYIHMAFSFVMFDDKSEDRIIGSTMIQMGGEIAKEDMLKMYEYAENKFFERYLESKEYYAAKKSSQKEEFNNENSELSQEEFDDFTFVLTPENLVDIDNNPLLKFLKSTVSIGNKEFIYSICQNVHFSVSGYDNDERELFEIPEFIVFCRVLIVECPSFFYFLDRTLSSLVLMAVLDGKPREDGQCYVDPDKIEEFIKKHTMYALKFGMEVGYSENEMLDLFGITTNTITILGVEMTPESHPNLYQWAQTNPAWLEKTLQSMVDKGFRGNMEAAGMAAYNLESDLQHESLLN